MMLLAALATPLAVLAAVAAVIIVLLPAKFAIAVGIAGVVGTVLAVRARRQVEVGRFLHPGEAPELQAGGERLCALADLPRPDIELHDERQPNSWMIDRPGRAPRLHVTTALLEGLDGPELEAVVAHELAHVANRDATVMTVVGGPGAALLDGSAALLRIWQLW